MSRGTTGKLGRPSFQRHRRGYEAHYSDPWSQRYRAKFINPPMLGGIDFDGLHVLEAMCGSGQTTDYLLRRGARVTGLDVSPAMMVSFRRRWPECGGICASVLDVEAEDATFDAVALVSGLHHVQPHLDKAMDEIHRILKPGGFFCFGEPHAGSLPDKVRQLWYSRDKRFFEANERAVDIEWLKSNNAHRFDFIRDKYLGSIAYLLVLNSLIFRLPLWSKRWYSPILLGLESLVDPLMTKALACYAVCQWRKKMPGER